MNPLFYYAIWLSFMACGFLGWYFSHKAKHEERKMLIQNGLTSDEAAKVDKGPRLLSVAFISYACPPFPVQQ